MVTMLGEGGCARWVKLCSMKEELKESTAWDQATYATEQYTLQLSVLVTPPSNKAML